MQLNAHLALIDSLRRCPEWRHEWGHSRESAAKLPSLKLGIGWFAEVQAGLAGVERAFLVVQPIFLHWSAKI